MQQLALSQPGGDGLVPTSRVGREAQIGREESQGRERPDSQKLGS